MKVINLHLTSENWMWKFLLKKLVTTIVDKLFRYDGIQSISKIVKEIFCLRITPKLCLEVSLIFKVAIS